MTYIHIMRIGTIILFFHAYIYGTVGALKTTVVRLHGVVDDVSKYRQAGILNRWYIIISAAKIMHDIMYLCRDHEFARSISLRQ